MTTIRPLPLAGLSAGFLLCLPLIGCQPAETSKTAVPVAEAAHDHGHSSEDPHHGLLIELGNEEYHAELVHDDASGQVTVYMLDSSAKKAAPVTATEVVINVKHGDTPEQHKLSAQPEEGNPAGQSSRFAVTDKELAEHLHEAAAGAKLNITIGDTPYSGTIPVDHHNHQATSTDSDSAA